MAAPLLLSRSTLPAWLTPFCARALLGRRAQEVAALILGTLPVAALLASQQRPNLASLNGTTIIVVLAAGWLVRCWLLAPILAIACVTELARGAMTGEDPIVTVIELLVMLSVGLVTRLGVLGLTYVRDARHHEVSTLLLASHAFGAADDLERVAVEAVRAAARTVARPGLAGGRHAALIRVRGDQVALIGACDATGVEVLGTQEVVLGSACAVIRQMMASGRSAVVTAGQVPAALPQLVQVGRGSAWALARVPVAGEPFGVLAVASPHPSEFRTEDLRLLEGIARVAGLAIATALHQTELVELKMRLQHSVELALEAGRSLEPSDVVASTLVRVADSVAADRVTLARLVDDDLVVESTYWVGGPLLAVGRRFPPESIEAVPSLAWALASSQPVMGGPLEAGPAGRDLVGSLIDGEHTLLFPFVIAEQMSCVLVMARHGGPPFETADLTRLDPMADVALLALRNAHLYTQNARLLAEARQVGRTKSSFLNLAAHELRTPLAVIKGYLSMLEDGTYEVPQETRDDVIHTLVLKTQELEALVEALLTTARLEVGALPGSPALLDVGDAVRAALERIAPRARLEHAAVGSRLPDGPLPSRADQTHVARILDNLLNNALTYSHPPADVTVTIRCRDDKEDDLPPLAPQIGTSGGLDRKSRFIEVVVEDQGLGIPAEQHDRVFERFTRLDGGASRFSPGLGLGLSISRELAQLNGGSLILERSAPGEGSTFVLRLALSREESLDARSARAQA